MQTFVNFLPHKLGNKLNIQDYKRLFKYFIWRFSFKNNKVASNSVA